MDSRKCSKICPKVAIEPMAKILSSLPFLSSFDGTPNCFAVPPTMIIQKTYVKSKLIKIKALKSKIKTSNKAKRYGLASL